MGELYHSCQFVIIREHVLVRYLRNNTTVTESCVLCNANWWYRNNNNNIIKYSFYLIILCNSRRLLPISDSMG